MDGTKKKDYHRIPAVGCSTCRYCKGTYSTISGRNYSVPALHGTSEEEEKNRKSSNAARGETFSKAMKK